MFKRLVLSGLTRLGVLSGHPAAFAILILYTLAWIVFDRASLDFHGVATIATWAMTLFIQRAEHRDTQAIQAKLDELLRTHQDARSQLTHLDEQPAEEIERHRDEARAKDPR